MKKIILFPIFLSLTAQANICDRNAQFLVVLEKKFKTHCSKITPQDISQLKILDAINKKITNLKASDLSGFTSLEWLRLGKNEISSLPEDLFKDTTQLRFLGLSENKITLLPANIFKSLTKLEKVNLNHNQINEIPEGFISNNLQLQVFSIAENNIKNISENLFKDLHQLNYVNLFNNKIPEEKLNILKKKFPKIQIN
jgi:Leucine-rich repeat (LRR) protein